MEKHKKLFSLKRFQKFAPKNMTTKTQKKLDYQIYQSVVYATRVVKSQCDTIRPMFANRRKKTIPNVSNLSTIFMNICVKYSTIL
jgi:hypothetical protein